MTIKFNCEHCRKEVQASDAAGGKRGKCPYCGAGNYIPAPVDEGEILSLAPLDEEEERQREQEIRRLMQQEKAILEELNREPAVPLEHKEDLQSQDLHHFVVNYCLDMHSGNLARAELHVDQLKQFQEKAKEAVEDFATGRAIEPALVPIPSRLMQGFLRQLMTGLNENQ